MLGPGQILATGLQFPWMILFAFVIELTYI